MNLQLHVVIFRELMGKKQAVIPRIDPIVRSIELHIYIYNHKIASFTVKETHN